VEFAPISEGIEFLRKNHRKPTDFRGKTRVSTVTAQVKTESRKVSVAVTVREELLPPRDAVARFYVEPPAFGAAWRFLRQEFAAAWAACGMFEYIALGYLGVSSALIAAFSENLADPLRVLGIRAVVAAAILILCRAGERSVAGNASAFAPRFWHFWRHWYPHLFFLFCFEEMGKLMHLVQPGWQDAKLIAFDRWLTGVNPPLWLEQFANPALNEFMQFSYFTYFLFLLVLGAVLYYRREWPSYWAVMTYSAVAYSLGYVIATFFPVQSPWFTLAGMWHGDLTGGPFTAVINLIEKCGRVHGAAFPSQHVAGAMAALWGAWRHRRWLFWVFLPFVVCMCASTVYVRNHYVADVLAGLVTGTLGYIFGKFLFSRWPHRAAARHDEACHFRTSTEASGNTTRS
jgi:membrane-associated phospholipid phosphatase